MKECTLLVLNRVSHHESWAPARHRKLLKRCEAHIGRLKKA